MHSKPGRRGPGVALGTLLTLALAALAPAAAEAKPPRITQAPVVGGTPQVGATVQAEGARWDDSDAEVAWQWYRCTAPGDPQRTCSAIDGARSISYEVTSADLGLRLRVMLHVSNDDGSASELSESSSAVTAAPAPTPTPSPSPDPSTATATGTASPTSQPAPAASPAPAGGVLDTQTSRPRMMDPAPVVRIRGRLTRSGARITLLTVRAPRGARIGLRCIGDGCPARRWAGTASLTRIARFQAALPAGTRLVISVTKAGRIGKHTTIVIRRGQAPLRRDRCLMPGSRKPVRCAAV